MHLAFASSEEAVGYMDSCADGEEATCVVGVGSGREPLLRRYDGCAVQAHGHGCAVHDVGFDCEGVDGAVAMPRELRVGERTRAGYYAGAGTS